MAFVHGKDAYLQLDGTAGTLVNITAYTDSVDGLPGEVELSDVTAFGDEGHKNIPGLDNASFTVGGSWDATLDGTFGSTTQWKAATRSFEFGPAGNTGGLVKLSGECWITNYTVSAGVGDKVSWSASLQVDGQVTRGTF